MLLLLCCFISFADYSGSYRRVLILGQNGIYKLFYRAFSHGWLSPGTSEIPVQVKVASTGNTVHHTRWQEDHTTQTTVVLEAKLNIYFFHKLALIAWQNFTVQSSYKPTRHKLESKLIINFFHKSELIAWQNHINILSSLAIQAHHTTQTRIKTKH